MRTIKALETLMLLGVLAGLASEAPAAERMALVIGNGRYAHAPYLNNPGRDARAVADALKGLGFAVTGPLADLGKAELEKALLGFGERAQGAEAVVVYYAGHGVEAQGQNYLIPVDAKLERESAVALEAVALEALLEQLRGAGRYRLVILDACRDNPLANRMRRPDGTRAVYRGLAPVEAGESQTYVAYAAKAGTPAQEGSGEHSPYTVALLKYLAEPLPLERLFGAVREEVLAATQHQQEPHLYGAFGREPIYLSGTPPATPAVPAPPTPLPASTPVEFTPEQILTALCGAKRVGKSSENDNGLACLKYSVLNEKKSDGETRILWAKSGAFSAPANDEILVVLADSEMSHADNYGGAILLRKTTTGLKTVAKWPGKVFTRCQKISSNVDRPDWLVCEGGFMQMGYISSTLLQIRVKDGRLESHVLLYSQNNEGACQEEVILDKWNDGEGEMDTKGISINGSGRTMLTISLNLKRGHRRSGDCAGKIRMREDRWVTLNFLEDDQGRLVPDPASAAIIQTYDLIEKSEPAPEG